MRGARMFFLGLGVGGVLVFELLMHLWWGVEF